MKKEIIFLLWVMIILMVFLILMIVRLEGRIDYNTDMTNRKLSSLKEELNESVARKIGSFDLRMYGMKETITKFCR